MLFFELRGEDYMDAISNALSGMRAQKMRVDTAAENIATAGVAGSTPKTVALTSTDQGVRAEISNRTAVPGLYDAGVPFLDDMMTLKTAEIAYKANISALKTASEMEQNLIETLA